MLLSSFMMYYLFKIMSNWIARVTFSASQPSPYCKTENTVGNKYGNCQPDKHLNIDACQKNKWHYVSLLLLLLLSRFSRVRLCATPSIAAHQASPFLGFSRQEHWSGLPFPSPMHESESEVAQSCLTPSDPMDCSLPGSSAHGILQARVLEWGAIAFSDFLAKCILFLW